MGWEADSKYQRTWRPLTIADVNRYSVSWIRRNEARDRLDDLSFEHQKTAAEAALGRTVQDSELKTRPQRGPLHTHYPAYAAARACLGLSAIAEFKSHAGRANSLLRAAVALPPEKLAGLEVKAATEVSKFVLEGVSNRLCIDQLYRVEGLGAVESYRLFAAAMIDLRFTHLKDLILAATNLGDLVFSLVKRESVRKRIHPLAHRILAALAPACHAYELAVWDISPEQLAKAGVVFAKQLMESLVPFLPLKQMTPPNGSALADKAARELLKAIASHKRVPLRRSSEISEVDEELLSRPLAGNDDPVPPAIDQPGPLRLKGDPKDTTTGKNKCSHCGTQNPPANTCCTRCGKQIHEGTASPSSGDTGAGGAPQAKQSEQTIDGRLQSPESHSLQHLQAQAIVQRATSAIIDATRGSQWDDPRVDQVAQTLRTALFQPGAIEAQLLAQRHRVTAYGSAREGTVHEEVLPRCRDNEALHQLEKGAAPIEKKLRGYRWFGQRKEAMVDRLQTRGTMDHHRLSHLATSSLVRRRWQRRDVTDYRGRPIVVLAKDGSSSNSFATTFAGKILAAAFLRIERLAGIRLYAADYSSDARGCLVRWLYHPQKTPGRSSLGAADAVASLPPKGQGANEDVLSISHILKEVLDSPNSSKQSVIVINITDGKFNSPIQDFRAMIRKLREDYRLTYSLVILGDTKVEITEADHIVHIPQTELEDPDQIAERIAKHVNTLIRSLRGKARRCRV